MQSIYLDHAATTPCDPRVFEAMRPFFFELGGNASSPHHQGRRARKALEESRESLAHFLRALPTEIVFTSGASESNNQAIFSMAKSFNIKGKHIIASAIEHHSVLEPLHQLEKEGFQVSYIKPQLDGIIGIEDIKSAVRSDTILICLIHANNEIGTIQPVNEIGYFCRQQDIRFLVDATQTIGHIPIDVKVINCDFLSLSAHKFYGPQGIGALYVRGGLCAPLIFGGDQERGRRAGTLNIPGIVGLGKAVKLCQEEMAETSEKEIFLRNKVIDIVLNEIPGTILNGHRDKRLPNNAHFSFDGINGEELISALDMSGIAVSMGSACTWGSLEPSHVLKAIGLSDKLALGSLRVTVGRSTTVEEINFFLEQLKLKTLRDNY